MTIGDKLFVLVEAVVDKNYLTLREAAQLLGVHYNTICRYVKNNEIPWLKIGKSVYIPANFADEMTVSPKGISGGGNS